MILYDFNLFHFFRSPNSKRCLTSPLASWKEMSAFVGKCIWSQRKDFKWNMCQFTCLLSLNWFQNTEVMWTVFSETFHPLHLHQFNSPISVFMFLWRAECHDIPLCQPELIAWVSLEEKPVSSAVIPDQWRSHLYGCGCISSVNVKDKHDLAFSLMTYYDLRCLRIIGAFNHPLLQSASFVVFKRHANSWLIDLWIIQRALSLTRRYC